VRDVERVTCRRSGEFNVLEPEEVHAVIRAAKGDQDACIFAVAAFAGLRMGEIRALRWRDIYFSTHTIHVRANFTHGREGLPKSGKVRAVPLIDQVAARLDALSRREHFTEVADLVFPNATGTHIHEGRLRRRFYDALDAAGLAHKRAGDRPITFHDLRHTFGTLAVKARNLPKVQGYMGHADITTTTGYVHHVPKTSDAQALNALVEQHPLATGEELSFGAAVIPAFRVAGCRMNATSPPRSSNV
jgi:integrase